MYWELFLGKNGCVMSKKHKILRQLQRRIIKRPNYVTQGLLLATEFKYPDGIFTFEALCSCVFPGNVLYI